MKFGQLTLFWWGLANPHSGEGEDIFTSPIYHGKSLTIWLVTSHDYNSNFLPEKIWKQYGVMDYFADTSEK